MKVLRVLVVLFILLPLAELSILYRLGMRFGFLETIAALFLVGFLGATLAQREGLRVIAKWNESLAAGKVPEDGVLSGILSLAAGLLFILPGVISDVAGLVLLFPPTRRLVASAIRKRFEHDLASGNATFVSFDMRSGSGFGSSGPDVMGRGGGHAGSVRGSGGRGVGRGGSGRPPGSGPDIVDVVGEDVTDATSPDPSRILPREDETEP